MIWIKKIEVVRETDEIMNWQKLKENKHTASLHEGVIIMKMSLIGYGMIVVESSCRQSNRTVILKVQYCIKHWNRGAAWWNVEVSDVAGRNKAA